MNPTVEATNLGAVGDMTIWGLFVEADIVVKLVMIGLLLASVWVWAIVFEKVTSIRRANRAYYEAYRRNANMMAIIEQVATFNEEFQELRRKHRAVAIGRSATAIERWQRAGSSPRTSIPR